MPLLPEVPALRSQKLSQEPQAEHRSSPWEPRSCEWHGTDHIKCNVVWRSPEMGVLPNHPFSLDFPFKTVHFGGTPIYGNPHMMICESSCNVVKCAAIELWPFVLRIMISVRGIVSTFSESPQHATTGLVSPLALVIKPDHVFLRHLETKQQVLDQNLATSRNV